VPDDTTVLDAARIGGIYLESPCNGNGTCGKCLVEANAQTVLACKTKITQNTQIKTIVSRSENLTMQIISGGFSFDYPLKPLYPDGYGLIVDIGTTTLVVSLINLATGSAECTESLLNPQTQYAQDVLSRIHFAGEEGGLRKMYDALISALNETIVQMTSKLGIKPEDIKDAVYSGNTTMLHLAAIKDPSPLGKYPYIPALTGGEYIEPGQLKIGGRVYLPPIISAYVGADVTSGILASGLADAPQATLFIDVGTNGELVLAKDRKLIATSTAAGPAFEGMNISQGKRASNGAIESFHFNEDSTYEYGVIGGGEADGICGSGLLDIVAELARTGRITKTGRFADKSRIFQITENTAITQDDIRQVQLAKGAIRTGIDAMLQRLGLAANDIERVEIAGSFGYHISERSLLDLKMLPEEFTGKVHFVGNTSHSGAAAFLLNTDFRTKMESTVEEIEKLELSNDDNFQKLFVASLGF